MFNAILFNGGDYTFRDCHWKSAIHQGSVFTVNTLEERGRLKIFFYNNVWDDNTYSDATESFYPLIFIGEGLTDVVFVNCTFTGNKINFSDKDGGYAIGISRGSTLTIENTCFIGNDFKGEGTVLVEDMSGITWENIYADDSGGSVGCHFIYNNSTKECIEADLEECPLGTGQETPAPTPSPTACPTPDPNSGDDKGTSASKLAFSCSIRFPLVTILIGLLFV